MKKKFSVNIDEMWKHQRNILTALRAYNFYNTSTEQRQAAVVFSSTSSGKTILLLVAPFYLDALPAVILVPTLETANRYAQEWPNVLNKFVSGKDLPARLPILTGASRKSDWSLAIHNSPLVVMTVPFACKRVEDIQKDPVKNESMKNFFHRILLVEGDEGHHLAAETWKKPMNAMPNAKALYATGTPIRNDNELYPMAPYEVTKVNDRKTTYTLLDLAEVTKIHGARYTLANALRDKKIKKPHAEFIDGTDLESTLNDELKIRAESLDEYNKKIKESGRRTSPHKDPVVYKEVLIRSRDIIEKARNDFKKAGKLTAILKAADITEADTITRMANAIGWHAIAYHSGQTDETHDESECTDTMRDRLRRFEDAHDPTDLCVQVNSLVEGYNNPMICMGIILCKVDSQLAIDQFLGRLLRLIKGVSYEDHPPATAVCLNINGTRERVKYWESTAFNLETVVIDQTPPSLFEGERITKQEAVLDGGNFYVVGWKEEIRNHDPITRFIADLHRENPQMSDASLEDIKSLIQSGRLPIPDVQQEPLLPTDPQEVSALFLSRKNEIVKFLHDNAGTEVRLAFKNEYKRKVAVAVHATVNKRWPGLKGGLGNRNLDFKQLHDFLTCDLDLVKIEALERLRRWVQEESHEIP